MPLQSPTFPRGPYRFFRRQYLVISYQSDPAAIREALPEPLVPAGDTVAVQWLDLPDGEGFGAYSAAAQIIPCTFKGEPCNFVSQMYVDNTPPLAGGREIWGYPMKYGKAVLKVTGDTLTGTLDYATQRAATGTMVYKHDAFRADLSKEKELLARTQVTLKMIPDIDGTPAIAQLVGINFADVKLQGAWTGEARLELIPAVNCPLADLPVRRVTGGLHMVTDMTLPYGRVLHDYLA
jgi:acetoacetate decarboxylase